MCDHKNITFTGLEWSDGNLTLNEGGEAGYYCETCKEYLIACLSCSNLEYNYSDDEICASRPHSQFEDTEEKSDTEDKSEEKSDEKSEEQSDTETEQSDTETEGKSDTEEN